MRSTSLFAVASLLIVGFAGPSVIASSQAPMMVQADPQPEGEAPASDDAETEEKKKRPFALYLGVARGVASTDTLDTSMETTTTHTSFNSLNLEDQIYSKAAIGWKLQYGKGDFRVEFTGFTEDGYDYRGVGRASNIVGLGNDIEDPLDWWTVDIVDGQMTSQRTPPQWTPPTFDGEGNILDPGSDTNEDNVIDRDEVNYIGADVAISRLGTTDLQNRTQTIDALYGRTFGKRRYSGRWWAGIRSFNYDGNMLAGAWLNTVQPGEGYTDGALLRPLVVSQETSGFGPTASLEADFNFFDDRLTLYVMGQMAFMVVDIESDTGPFITLVQNTTQPTTILPAAARLTKSQSKSTWQDAGEVGLRIKLKNGLGFELAYNITGYLDVISMPTKLRIPENQQEATQGTSATYRTQDLVIDGWRFGMSFQF